MIINIYICLLLVAFMWNDENTIPLWLISACVSRPDCGRCHLHSKQMALYIKIHLIGEVKEVHHWICFKAVRLSYRCIWIRYQNFAEKHRMHWCNSFFCTKCFSYPDSLETYCSINLFMLLQQSRIAWSKKKKQILGLKSHLTASRQRSRSLYVRK